MSSDIHGSDPLFSDPERQMLSPRRLAELLDITGRELASALQVHPCVMRLHPDNALLQDRLGAYAAVFARLLELRSDPVAAAFHMKNTPVWVLRHRTLFETVRDGDASKALRYLQTISGGQNG